MTGRRIVYTLGLVGGLIFYGAYQEWFSWMLLLILLWLPVMSLVLSLGAVGHMKMEPSVAEKLPMGAEERVLLKVSCKYALPPHKSKFRITKPFTGESRILKAGELLPTGHCGGYVVELYRPGVCDYLGLFRFRVRNAPGKTVYVMPDPVGMELPPDLNRYLAQRWRPKPGGGYAENHEIRQYHPGDNLNQIHWKLSAKAGELMLREPMEPERGLMLLTMDLCGTEAELDKKLGKLLWLGKWMLEHQLIFEVRVLTGKGIETWTVRDEWDMNDLMESLLCSGCCAGASIRDRAFTAAWQYHIGGDPDAS